MLLFCNIDVVTLQHPYNLFKYLIYVSSFITKGEGMDTDSFDVDRFRLTVQEVDLPNDPPVSHPRKKRARFLRGPVPWEWICKAMTLGRGPLALGMVLWHLRGLKRSDSFRLPPSATQCVGDRITVYRSLRALERAGLVHVERHQGRGPTVSLIDRTEADLPPEANSLDGGRGEVHPDAF
jgi:hypothetical protein